MNTEKRADAHPMPQFYLLWSSARSENIAATIPSGLFVGFRNFVQRQCA